MITKMRKGFTLIELLVVIAIIALLSTLAVVALNSAREKSRDAKRVADIKQIQTALELYFTDQNAYPVAATALTLGGTSAVCLGTNGFQAAGACTGTTYMGQVPSNPTPAGTTTPYAYVSTSGSGTYSIGFGLEGLTGSLVAGAHVASPTGIQ